MHAAPTITPTARATLAERCRALGLPALWVPAEGEPAPVAGQSPIVDSLLRSPFVLRRVAEARTRWQDEDKPGVTEVWPGCFALPVAERARRRVSGWFVALHVTAEGLSAEQMDAACQAASADARAVRAALAASPAHSAPTAPLMLTLRWMWDDQQSSAACALEVGGFSRQLTETYEELSLLYRLGRSMNEVDRPERFVRLVCDELRATLPFRWIAAVFHDSPALPTGVSGLTLHAADAADAQRIAAISRAAIAGLSPGEARVIGGDEAAALGLPAGEELLVQPVTRQGGAVGAIIAGERVGEDRVVT